MGGWWVHEYWNASPAFLVSWVVWAIGAVVLHELGHGWAAIRFGDRTPIETGHMTWNPAVHMGTMGMIVFAVIGLPFGAMPVDPSRMRGRHAESLMSLAGPMMNLALAAGALVAGMIWMGVGGGHWIPSVHANEPLYSNLVLFFRVGLWLNMLLMVFNLVPVPPLDGSRIVAHYSPPYRRFFFETENGRWVGLGLFLLLFFFGADYILGYTSNQVADLWDAIASALGLA